MAGLFVALDAGLLTIAAGLDALALTRIAATIGLRDGGRIGSFESMFFGYAFREPGGTMVR